MPRKIYDVVFTIIWDEPRRAFAIERDGAPTGRAHLNKVEAIKMASQAARFETREGRTAVVYSFNSERKQIVEWSG